MQKLKLTIYKSVDKLWFQSHILVLLQVLLYLTKSDKYIFMTLLKYHCRVIFFSPYVKFTVS